MLVVGHSKMHVVSGDGDIFGVSSSLSDYGSGLVVQAFHGRSDARRHPIFVPAVRGAFFRNGAFAGRTLDVEQACRSFSEEGNETCLFWGHCARCVTALVSCASSRSLWCDTVVFQPGTCSSSLVICASRPEMGRHSVGNLDVAMLDIDDRCTSRIEGMPTKNMSASLRIAAASQNDPEQNLTHVRSYPVQADGDWPCCRSTAVDVCRGMGVLNGVRTGGHWLDGHSPTAQGHVVTARAK